MNYSLKKTADIYNRQFLLMLLQVNREFAKKIIHEKILVYS